MQSSTGQYSTHAGDPAHPVQHSVITANSLGFFLRGVARPLDFGSNLSSSGTIPTALVAPPDAAGIRWIIAQKCAWRRVNLRRLPAPSVQSDGSRLIDAHAPRARHALRACAAISNTLPAASDRADRIPHSSR